MADFRLNVTAETREAERKLREVDRAAEQATKTRSIKIDTNFVQDTSKRFKDLQTNLKDAANNVQTFYRVSKNIPGLGERVREFESLAKGTAELAKNAPGSAAALRENAKAGSILSNSLETAGSAAGRLVNTLAKTGLAIFAVKEAVGVLKSAFGGFFNETIGREIKLRETILKTQTTLASTNKVFRNGKEITDPYEKIVALTGEVQKRVDSIRERSIALAGVTSNEVIEVFGIVASQVGQIGGGLKEAEDLAINFAAALGTFGIPLYQARQEIGSILRGDITMDSYLAKALGITNDDVAKAKTQAGGVIKFLEERLAASVAGQRIAAQGFAGVVSNIRDLSELVSQKFGAGLLDPLLGGLTRVFDFLFKIREEVFAIAEGAGRGLGQVLGNSLTIIGGGSALFGDLGAGAEDFAAQLAEGVKKAFASLQGDVNGVIAPIRNLIEELTKSFGLLAAGLARLAQGFIDIKIENFKALVQIFSNLSEAVTIFSMGLGKVLTEYGKLLQVPFVQYLSQLSAQFQILEKIGVMSAVKLGFAVVGVIAAWTPLVTFFQGLVAKIAAFIGGLVLAVGAALTRIGAVVAAFAATLTATSPTIEVLKQELLGLSASLTTAGAAADEAGASVTRLGGATAGAAKTAATAILGFLKFNLLILAIQVGITVLIDLFGRFQQERDKIASDKRAEEALVNLKTTYKDVGDTADEATKRAKAFEQALVDARYDAAVENLEKIRQKLQEIRDLNNRPDLDLGVGFQRLGAALNPDNWGALFAFRQNGQSWMDIRAQQLEAELRKAQGDKKKWATEINAQAARDNIQLEANNRKNLEKEIGDLRKRQEDQLFQLRQQQAQKEVEIFRLAGELRIFQMEQANKKLIEGEEGASAAALDALNNYLSVRERGELEIEAAKKGIVIEAANLERQIADYRLDNERKIAEIRKKAGDYDKKIADYQRQMAQATAQTGPQPIGGIAGRTGGDQAGPTRGRSTGPHLHAQSSGMSEAELRAFIDAALVFPNGAKASSYGTSRGYTSTHGGIDYLTPQGTPYSLAQGYTARSIGVQGNLGLGQEIVGPDGRRATLGHLVEAFGGGTGAAPTAPAAPNYDDIGAPAVAKYASAVRSLAGAMERARALQEALTNAKTAAAFEEIAKAAFPKVALEQYDDQLIEARIGLDALAKSAGDAYDPERLRIAVEIQSRLAIQERELQQIRDKSKQTLTPEEQKKLEDDLVKRKAEFVAQLQQEKKLREQLLPLIRAQAAIEGLRRDTAAVPFDIQRAGAQAIGAMAGAYADDPIRRRMIEAETRIAERRIQLEQDLSLTTEDVRRELAAYAAAQRAAAQTLGELDQATENFVNVLGTLREVSRTIADGYKGFFQELLTGGDLEAAMNSMLQSITDKFLSMTLDAAFKPVEQLFTDQLKGLFGIEDPMQKFEAENTAALAAITTAQEAAAATQQRAADTQMRAAEMQLQAATTPVAAPLPGSTGPMSQQFDSVRGPNGQIIPVSQAINQIVPIATQPFADAAETAANALADTTKQATAVNTTLAPLAENTARLTESVALTEQNIRTSGDRASQLTERFNGLMKAAGTAMSMLGGLAMGYAGISQMGKGGTYNTLMGLAGIFGGIGSFASGLGGLGNLFGGGGGGGAVAGLPSWSSSFNYVPSFAGGGYTGSGALAGGMDGKGGFLAMLHPNETVVDHSPYAATTAALEGGSSTSTARFSNEPIKLETRVINGTEYATVDQLREATRQAETRGAERGRALALGSLQNSVKTRKRVGIA